MATRYGAQFEDLMAEVCRDFGARLVRSWDREADRDEIKNFVSEAVENFFEGARATASVVIESPVKKPKASKKKSESPDLEPPSPVKKAKAKAKAKAKKSPEPDVVEVEIDIESAAATKKKAKKGSSKPKCQATTAKGTPCSKCALDGEVFCNVHMKKVVDEKAKAKGKAPAEKAEKVTKAKASKKKKESPPKHTHSLTSPPLKEACDLCETHGMPFEVPEYEEETKSVASEKGDDDPDFKLTEDDFEESDDDDSGTDLDEEEFDELD